MEVLEGFLRKARAASIDNEAGKERLDTCKEIVGYILSSPKEWDDRCAFNIRENGDQFLQALRSFNQTGQTDIDGLHSMTRKFLCEFNYFSG